jgi:hypothetical protein
MSWRPISGADRIGASTRGCGRADRVGDPAGKVPCLIALTPCRRQDADTESIRFYTTKIGLRLAFQYRNFYAGIQAGNHLFHLKLVDEKDPSIEFVDKGEHFHLYFEIDDADAAAAALEASSAREEKSVDEDIAGCGGASGADVDQSRRANQCGHAKT